MPVCHICGMAWHEEPCSRDNLCARIAALEKKCDELRANLENVCMMIRRLHRKHKIETLDSSFIVQCVEMANRYCPPQITRDGEQARKDD